MDMKNYTTLLFDADGTLLDFDACEDDALKETFRYYGYPYNEQIKQAYLTINKELWSAYENGEKTREDVIYSRFGKLFQQLQIDDDGIAFANTYLAALSRGHQVIPDALEVISTLAKSFDLYIVTNGVIQTQYRRLKESKLQSWFQDVFISEEIGYRKPQKEYFTTCFARIKEKDPNKLLLIGDSLASDMQGGFHAGIDTCWFNPKQLSNEHSLPITYEIRQLKELYNIVGGSI